MCDCGRNGVIRSEPIQQLRVQLDKLGKMTGLTQEEKGKYTSLALCLSSLISSPLPEEVLNLLFKQVLSILPFISIE